MLRTRSFDTPVAVPEMPVSEAGRPPAAANSGTTTGPLTPTLPWWMWPRVGGAMPNQVDAVLQLAQLAAYRTAGELGGVQVGVELLRVGPQRVQQRCVGDGDLAGGPVQVGRQRRTEEGHLDRAVEAGGALVHVARGERAEVAPRHAERDLVALDAQHLDGAPVRVTDGGAAGYRYLVAPAELGGQEDHATGRVDRRGRCGAWTAVVVGLSRGAGHPHEPCRDRQYRQREP